MAVLYEYIWPFASQWVWLMGIPSVISGVVGWWCPQRATKLTGFFSVRKPFGLSMLIITIFLSGFFAWKGEHTQLLEARKIASAEPSLAVINNLQDQLNQANAALAEIKEQNKSRRLTEEQIEKIIAILSPHKGASVEVVCVSEDAYCSQWRTAFADSGWHRVQTQGRSVRIFEGFRITSKVDNENVRSLIAAVNIIDEKPDVDFKNESLSNNQYQFLIGEKGSVTR